MQVYFIFIGPVPPPERITLSLDHPNWLIFSWSEVITGCEALHYKIVASNCGSCPATTVHTTVVCTNIPINSNICTFAIQTVVCDGLAGNVSDPIHVLLRGTTCHGAMIHDCLYYIMYAFIVPDPPTGLKVIPRYSYDSGHFSGVTVEFNTETVKFSPSVYYTM